MVNYTPNLRLTQPDFDQTPWDEQINGDLSILDTAYGAFIAINGLSGVWQNSVAYLVGQSVIDTTNSSVWQCSVAHTSAVAPTTFAQDRTAHPTYWMNVFTGIVFLPTTGGTLTGNLVISQPPGVASVITGAVTDVHASWSISLGNAASNTGSNAGSDFAITRFSDAGSVIDSPMVIERATGQTTFNDHVLTTAGISSTEFIATDGFTLFSSGGRILSNNDYTLFIQDSNLYRWQYKRVDGTLEWVNGAINTALLSIDGFGNLITLGTITASGSPVVTEARVAELEARIAALEARVP